MQYGHPNLPELLHPSLDSKRVFDESESLLTGSDGLEKHVVQSAVITQASSSPKATSPQSSFALEILLAELNSLIGLKQVKQDVAELASLQIITLTKVTAAKSSRSPRLLSVTNVERMTGNTAGKSFGASKISFARVFYLVSRGEFAALRFCCSYRSRNTIKMGPLA